MVTVSSTAASVATASVAEANPQMQLLVRNYDSVDADQQHGGTQLQDIITYAYNNNHFKSGAVSFAGLLRPHRFLDNAKFKHCLDLFDVVATEEQFTTLKTADLDATVVENVANTIKDSCLAQLVLWEALKKPKKQDQDIPE